MKSPYDESPESLEGMRRMQQDPKFFRGCLRVSTGARRSSNLGEILEPWQEKDFIAMDPAWAALVTSSEDVPTRRAYLERPRGHSKTTDLAVMAAWALAFSPNLIQGAAAAGDREQARLMRDAINRIVRLNDWLGDFLTVTQYRVHNKHTGSFMDILASDSNTSYGLLLDFLVVDEITNWPNKGKDLWNTLFSGVAKRPNCICVVISNAGLGRGSSWQWRARESARKGNDWHFSRIDGAQASWITQKELEEQQDMLPPATYSRLWENEWQVEEGNALPQAQVEAAIVRKGPIPQYETETEPYVAGLDLGAKHDHCGLVVLSLDVPKMGFRLAEVNWWDPKEYGGDILFARVRDKCLDVNRRYSLQGIMYDKWQCKPMAESLAVAGVRMYEFRDTPKVLNHMALSVLDVFRNSRIELYRDEHLIRDLYRISVVERSHGHKIEAPRDEYGHADRAMAMFLAMLLGDTFMRDWSLYGEAVEEVVFTT
jgi:phage terminase large subunit-like protein